MGQITIYPNKKLEKVIVEKAEIEKRSINNFLIYILEENFKKELAEIKVE